VSARSGIAIAKYNVWLQSTAAPMRFRRVARKRRRPEDASSKKVNPSKRTSAGAAFWGLSGERMSPHVSRKPPPSPANFGDEQSSELAEIIWALVVERGNPSQVLELLYWSEEPGFFELIRSLAALPPETRDALQAFCAEAHSPLAITASADRRDRLTLQAGGAKELTSFRKSARVASDAS
jgi:hypothetical protein